jgi:hypothetical protein
MDSNLHMHVASLQIQDQIRAASTARLAKQAKQAKQASRGTVTSRAPRIALRRLFHPTLRRAS